MKQEVGETRDAIIEDAFELMRKIVDKNKDLKDPYWIVLAAKKIGPWEIRQHIKAYRYKPKSLVGMCTFEVNNATGEIKPEVNLPNVPFDWNALGLFGAKRCDELVTETSTIANAYITQ